MISKFTTLIEVLRHRASVTPQTVLYSFIEDGNERKSEFTYSQLDERARAIASYLQTKINKNDRALLLYQPGLDYIEAFMGCLYAGVIPVPAYPPDGRNLKRLLHVINDANAAIALSTEAIYNNVSFLSENGASDQIRKESSEFVQNIQWHLSDTIATAEADKWNDADITKEDVAFLQYTSGSTNNPKGVIVTHHNLMTNFDFSEKAFEMSPERQMVSWLPPYHDMGLIGGILQPLYSGMRTTLISPVSFIKKPLKWLSVISECGKNGKIISGAPNFAYELCVNKISDDQINDLDLSNWTLAFNGAEPIRAATLEAFAEKFKTTGFKKEHFFPVYGLAEATLLVSAGNVPELPIVKKVNKILLEENTVTEKVENESDFIEKVGCGVELKGQKLRIVDPATKIECEENTVGEIWISGPNVAKGYWENPEETEMTFNCTIENEEDSSYFRTGDLGYLNENQLYVTGRLKDLIIIRGKNHYPQDIEFTVQNSHEALRKDYGAAFSLDLNGEEQLVIIQEVKREFKRKIDIKEISNIIRSAVSKEHQLVPAHIILIEPSTFPKTSSGKLQRRASKDQFLKNELKELETETAYSL
ncbi:fatty acyl-AMP ligase [Flavobacterium sp. H122]|uniref:fatty acyl-AMP ligase n=1 Tax=Flavobacterium sp. H122 TaxID=2529860 RepID=UPI0010AA9DA8|nr:fatty acyl-AMP ligase [Flavobacterium sp. H122]